MMEPLRGTADHVGNLIDTSDNGGRAARTTRRLTIDGRRSTSGMAERTQKHKQAPGRTERGRRDRSTRRVGDGREVEGRARRPARRDRRGARDQRRGLRQVVRAKGRSVARVNADLRSGRRPRIELPGTAAPGRSRDICRSRRAATLLGPARDHVRRARFADGVVMAGDRRATSGNLISHRSMEKVVQADQLQRRGDRRSRRTGDGDDPAVPAAAGALREGRGLRAQPRGQGQPAVDDGPRQPPGGDAGHGRRPDLRRIRHSARRRATVRLRRHRRPVRGARLRRHRLGQPARRHGDQGRLPRPT